MPASTTRSMTPALLFVLAALLLLWGGNRLMAARQSNDDRSARAAAGQAAALAAGEAPKGPLGLPLSPAHSAPDAPLVSVRLLDGEGRATGPLKLPAVVRGDAEWKARLTDEQFRILRGHGTERAFCGLLWDHHDPGTYVCAGCSLPLFDSDAKFESGTGWPSYWAPVAKDNVLEKVDRAYGMIRTEILCARCGGHLGHVFPDGPPPTGLRYCLNSESLVYVPRTRLANEPEGAHTAATAYFAAGCFWGVEEAFRTLPGVTATAVGYSGGRAPDATYEQVCSGTTGHAETVRVNYDPQRVSYSDLLEAFFGCHDPTQKDRQGPDHGTQYRSALFTLGEEQAALARATIAKRMASGTFANPIVTEVEPFSAFVMAEDYHQQYLLKSGEANCHLPQ